MDRLDFVGNLGLIRQHILQKRVTVDSNYSPPKGSLREQFADFLERLAAQRSTTLEWHRYIVVHYSDVVLEEMRRCVVRLTQNRLPIHGDTEAGRELLFGWAIFLRQIETSMQGETSNHVLLELSSAEAVVLMDLFRRTCDTNQVSITSPADFLCLAKITDLLEQQKDRRLWPDLETARAQVTIE